MLPDLTEGERPLYYRRCDTFARLWLNDRTLPEFDAGNFEGCSMLVHAERYLADRLAYELAPWPKGMINLETEQDYERPESSYDRTNDFRNWNTTRS